MPTFKQKIAASKVVENRGQIGKAMIAAGYSPKTDTVNLTRSKGWQQLMDKYIPDKRLLEKIDQGLDAKKPFSSHTEPDRMIDDNFIQHKYLETSLKLKKKLTDTQIGEQTNVAISVINYGNNDPLSVYANTPDEGSLERPTSLSSPQLAPQGTKNNVSNKPTDTVG